MQYPIWNKAKKFSKRNTSRELFRNSQEIYLAYPKQAL